MACSVFADLANSNPLHCALLKAYECPVNEEHICKTFTNTEENIMCAMQYSQQHKSHTACNAYHANSQCHDLLGEPTCEKNQIDAYVEKRFPNVVNRTSCLREPGNRAVRDMRPGEHCDCSVYNIFGQRSTGRSNQPPNSAAQCVAGPRHVRTNHYCNFDLPPGIVDAFPNGAHCERGPVRRGDHALQCPTTGYRCTANELE